MKKVIIVFFALALALGFAFVTDGEARCEMTGGGCSGCMCGGACGNPGCMCAGGVGGMGAMKGGCSGCICGGACGNPGCMCAGGMGGMGIPKMGKQHMGPGMMNPMMKVFLDETKDLRKKLMEKRFEYQEAARNFDVPVEDLMKMEKEIKVLQMKINRYWLK